MPQPVRRPLALGVPPAVFLSALPLLLAVQARSQAAPLPVRERLDRCVVYSWVDVDGREAIERCRSLHAGYAYRAWFNWAGQYPYLQRWVVPQVQDMGTIFCGGVTVPAYYPHQRAPEGFRELPERDEDWATCNPCGEPLKSANAYYHGSLYDPRYRRYVTANAREQIELGVDVVTFDEICGALGGTAGGYDQACLDQFRDYLLARHAELPAAVWKARFDIADPAAFDYRTYLADHGWLDDPETGANPLSSEFGSYNGWLEGRCNQYPYHEEGSFRRQAWLGFWQEFVECARAAGRRMGRDVLVAQNGLAPFTDVQEFALLFARPGTLQDGLDGSLSVLDRWHSFAVDSRERYGLEVPVMGHHDWHDAKTNADMLDLPPEQQMAYLRLYSAEAYASGGYYTFNEGGGGSGYADHPDTYATQEHLAGFYQQHASFYARLLRREPLSGAATVDTPHIAVKAWHQPALGRVLVHLVNHNWDRARREVIGQSGVTVTVRAGLPAAGLRAWVVSPDFAGTVPLAVTAGDGCVRATAPRLEYYDVVVFEPTPAQQGLGELRGVVRETHGRPVAGAKVSVWGTSLTTTTDTRGRYRLEGVATDGPAAGLYEVNVEAEGYWPGRAQGVWVRPGETVTQGFVLGRRDLIEDFETGLGAWLQMSRPARPWAAGLRPTGAGCPGGGKGAGLVSLSRTGSDGHAGDQAEAAWDTPVTETVRGVSGLFDAESREVRFWAKSLSGPTRVQLVLREYDSPWDLNEGAKSPSHAAEVTVEGDRWREYTVPLDGLQALNGLPLKRERVRLLILRAAEEAPARVALDEIRVLRAGAAG